MSGRYSKRLAGILCLALLICGIGRCPIPAAAGTNKGANTVKTSYALSELKEAANWGAEVKKDGNAVSLSFSGQYGMIFYAIPDEILAAELRGFECKFKGEGTGCALKLVGKAGDFKGINIAFGGSRVTTMDFDTGATIDDVADIRNIAFMNTKNGANTVVIESITFLIKQELDEKDIINLKDAMTYVMGDDFIVGTAICNPDLADEQEMQLVTKHFNAVTFGNELKPQFIFTNYYGNKYPQDQLDTVTINGKSLPVPRLDYSTPETGLNYFCDWNQKHPDNKISIRGHVLIWHSQTPEWFFHVDYDANKPYVDKETMSLREEWYIKSVAEHFTGKDSKYRELFYAWDVVNEAASDDWTDPTHIYRTEESGWWAVFKSNQFITNAFVFANKYMPKSVELYYNDYNDCWDAKVPHIVELLKAVRATPGARIDGMGMQAHYGVVADGISPNQEAFKKAVRAYCEVVDHVQITELDFGASEAYDGTEKTQAAEDERVAARYKEIYDAIKSLRDEGRRVTGLTVWGVTDKNSWLHGTTGRPQCPLLFDNNYHAKKAFYVLAEGGKAPEAADDTAAIEPKFSTVTLKKGESIFFELADGVDTESIKKITYKSNKAVVSVNKKGKITAKKKGSATVTATVKLKNGDTKKIKMKIKVVV